MLFVWETIYGSILISATIPSFKKSVCRDSQTQNEVSERPAVLFGFYVVLMVISSTIQAAVPYVLGGRVLRKFRREEDACVGMSSDAEGRSHSDRASAFGWKQDTKESD